MGGAGALWFSRFVLFDWFVWYCLVDLVMLGLVCPVVWLFTCGFDRCPSKIFNNFLYRIQMYQLCSVYFCVAV